MMRRDLNSGAVSDQERIASALGSEYCSNENTR